VLLIEAQEQKVAPIPGRNLGRCTLRLCMALCTPGCDAPQQDSYYSTGCDYHDDQFVFILFLLCHESFKTFFKTII
jgi:hypothetical protein